MTRCSISSNHHSFDIQISDAMKVFRAMADAFDVNLFHSDFPEYDNLKWAGSWVNTEVSDVDPEYMHWVADWLESHTPIYWEDGEPWLEEEDTQ